MMRKMTNSTHTDGGHGSPSAHILRVCSSPHRHKRKFVSAHVCNVSFKHLPQPLRNHYSIFVTLWASCKVSKPEDKISKGWVPKIFYLDGSLYFCYLGALANLLLTDDRKEREIKPLITATTFSPLAHTLLADQNYHYQICFE